MTMEKEIEIGVKTIEKTNKYAGKLQRDKEIAFKDLTKAQSDKSTQHLLLNSEFNHFSFRFNFRTTRQNFFARATSQDDGR